MTTGTLLLGLLLVACGGSSPKPQTALNAYLAAWGHRDWTVMAALVDRPPPDFAARHTAVQTQLGVNRATYTAGSFTSKGTVATAALTSHLILAAYGPLTLSSTVTLHRLSGRWLIEWSPQVIAAQFAEGDRFAVSETWPSRAPILGAGGASLTPDATTVTVGLQGSAIKDPGSLQAALVGAGLDSTKVTAAITAAAGHPDQFEPIETVPEARYQQMRSAIYPLPGTRFQTQTEPGALTPDLAAHVVGTVGPVTAEQLAKLGRPYQSGDAVGQTGLQGVGERQLAGVPAVSVKIVDGTARTVTTLGTTAPTAGQPIRTSLDPGVQQAAESALTGTSAQAAMVVMRASSGEVLASVSRPITQPFDLALDGELPPGSTFKVVSTAALLGAGVTADTTVTCPTTLTVDGRTFHNFEKETLATLTLSSAFALSCNTAFVGLAGRLTPGIFPTVAATFGLGTNYAMGLSASSGHVPAPADPVDEAATIIGQGRVVVSPLALATMAAAVDSGALHPPRLVSGAPDDTAPPQPLNPAVAAALRPMMAAVVTSGTASGAGLPAGTYGKTGTAEFGNANPPATHAWFLGYRGDLAFAVVVYGGGVGGAVAAPLAARLLKALGP